MIALMPRLLFKDTARTYTFLELLQRGWPPAVAGAGKKAGNE
jgi:hypothetical protein